MKENLINIGVKAKKASKIKIDSKSKNKVLVKFSQLINKNKKIILKENYKDIKFAIKNNLPENLIDRLALNPKKLEGILASINKIIKLSDPINKVLDKWKRPNGLIIKRVSTPIGVIGIIYESRPNVTSDVSSLCFKSGNVIILRGGSEAYNSNRSLANLFRDALKTNNIDQNYVQIVKNKNRKSVDYLLSKMEKFIDVIIPRGGKNLVKKVQELSSVPIIGHLEGICHTYIDKDADLKENFGYPIIGTDNDLINFRRKYKYAHITVGQVKSAETRIKLFEELTNMGYELPVIISPRSHISKYSVISAGTIIIC